MSIAERIASHVQIPWSHIMNTTKPNKSLDIPKVEFEMFLKRHGDAYNHTPDWRELERTEFQPVFLYCEFKKGGKQYDAIKDILRTKDNGRVAAHRAFTQECYEMWQTRDGINSIPIALTSNAPPIHLRSGTVGTVVRPARVRGQLVFVRSDLMNELDKRKGNGVLFKRRKIVVQTSIREQYHNDRDRPFTVEELYNLEVWAYLGKHKYWDQFLDGGYNLGKVHLSNYVPTWVKEPIYEFPAHKIARGQQP